MACSVDKDITYFNGFLILVVQVVAIVGNCLFFIGLIKFPQMRSATNIFLCCLAMADIIVALVPMSVTFAIYICSWGPRSRQDTNYKDIYTTYTILDICCGTASILSLTVIAMDRYFAINWPFVHQRTVNAMTAIVPVGIVWLVALMTSLVRLDKTIPGARLTLMNILISFAIPLVVMTFCYVNIAIIARRQSIRIAQLTAAGTSLQRHHEQETETTNDEIKNDEEGGKAGRINARRSGGTVCVKDDENGIVATDNRCDASRNSQDKDQAQHDERKSTGFAFKSIRRGTINAVSRMKAVGKELKAAKTLGVVMGVFLITWTPFMSLNIISYMYCYPLSPTCQKILTREAGMYTKLLHYLSSALNPCLYVLLNRSWRQVFRKMLSCCMENRVSGEARTSLIGGW